MGNIRSALQAIKTVFVGTYPCLTLAVNQRTDDTGGTDDVLCSQLVAHVTEGHRLARLHIDTFLKQADPHVAAAVFND